MQLKGKPDVLSLVFFFFLSFYWLYFDKWMALQWFCLETWIKEDTLVGKNECQREGGLEPSQYWKSIHAFHTFLLALALCRVRRLELFMGLRQKKNPEQMASPLHTFILWTVGKTQRKPTSTQREHTVNSTQRDSCSSAAHTAPHYTRHACDVFIWLIYFL